MVSTNQQRLYLQSRRNPLLNAFGKRSILRKSLETAEPDIHSITEIKPKPHKPPVKKRKSSTPSPLPTKAVTPYVLRAREMLEKMVEDLAEYEATLETLSPEELETQVQQEQDKEANEQKSINGTFMDILSTHADFGFWAKFAHWSFEEFAALSVGLDPKIATYKIMLPYENTHETASIYIKTYNFATKSFEAKNYAMCSPLMYLRWAQRIKLDIPKPLCKLIRQYESCYYNPEKIITSFKGSFLNRLDAQTYTWLCEEDYKKYNRHFREVARYIIRNNKSETRSEDAIKSSITRGLGEKALK